MATILPGGKISGGGDFRPWLRDAFAGIVAVMGARMVELDEQQCRRRLDSGGIGRAGVTVAALPAIFPVNYAILDGDIVFRTGPGTKLDAAVCGAVIAFEIDHFDPFSHTGWSVLVVGVARPITDPEEQARAEHLPLTPWADGQRDTYVRLEPTKVTGRVITTSGSAERPSGGRRGGAQ